MQNLKAPFPYFGGKSRIAHRVWELMGNPGVYVEPFFGSGAVLFARPGWTPGNRRIETVNEADGHLVNFWRAVQQYPDDVIKAADQPVMELDLSAWHRVIVDGRENMVQSLRADSGFCDPHIAGRWVWGVSASIGGGWGNRQGDFREVPFVPGAQKGCGVCSGTNWKGMVHALCQRLRYVRVCCGDWSRVCTNTPLGGGRAVAGVFLDPPYSVTGSKGSPMYASDVSGESAGIGDRVRAWCTENGHNEKLRVVLCGYSGDHEELSALGWRSVAWTAGGSYQGKGKGIEETNASRERLWCSPGCLDDRQGRLF